MYVKHTYINMLIYRRDRIQKFHLSANKAVPQKRGLCAFQRKQKNKVFLSQIVSRSKINPLQGRNDRILGCSKRISPMGSQIASGRKPSQPLPAHWDKCGNIPINHLSETVLPGGTVLLFCVLGIRFHTGTSVDYDQICQEDTFERQAGLRGTTRPVVC